MGKSSTVDTLTGDPFKESSATEESDVDICHTYNWQKITSQQFCQRLQEEYLRNLKEIAERMEIIAKANVATENKSNIFTTFFRKGQHSTSITKQQVPTILNDEIKEAKSIETAINKYEDGIDVTILDFAGQTQYHNIHSVFIKKESIIMVVFNASQLLSKIVKVKANTLRTEQMTNLQNIHFWMETVHSVCCEPGDENDMASCLPVILLVATHLDLLGDSVEESKHKIIYTLAKELDGKPYASHLAGNHEGLVNALRNYCIFLSNKIRDPEVVAQLQHTILKVSSPILSREYPLVCLKIERILYGINKRVITTKEFHAIASSCGFMAEIQSEEFARALQYFQHHGIVSHFASSETLEKIVILSPHWLTKLFSYVLIARTYQRIGSIGGKEDNSFRILIEKGILLGSFLTYMLEYFNSSEDANGFEVEQEQAKDLMKKFGFIAQINSKAKFLEEVKISNEKEIFIVPSLLPEDTANVRSVPEVDDRNVRVVYFYLPDHFLPPILFDQMVVKCIDRNEFKRETILW